MAEYLPPPAGWVRDQGERSASSGGRAGTTLPTTGRPVVLVTYIGRKTGAVRKTPLMRVVTEDGTYVLVASKGGAPEHPPWSSSLRAQAEVTIRDHARVFEARLREVSDPMERARLWEAAGAASPPYAAYQQRTERQIPLFAAEPR